MSASAVTGSTPRAEPFRCQISREVDSAHLGIVGDLDMAAVPILEAEITAARAAGFRRVIVDLRELAFIDSSGVRCILETDAEARQDGFALALIPGPPAVQRVFELTNTKTLLPFIDP